MKPTPQTKPISKRAESFRGAPVSSRVLPKTDYSYQAAGLSEFSGSCTGRSVCRPSFRAISEDYFKNEAQGEYAIEATAFVLIIAIAALPLFHSAAALIHLVRSTGAL